MFMSELFLRRLILGSNKNLYEDAGVDIDSGNEAVKMMKEHVKTTFNSSTLSELGSFGGLYSIKELKLMKNPISLLAKKK